MGKQPWGPKRSNESDNNNNYNNNNDDGGVIIPTYTPLKTLPHNFYLPRLSTTSQWPQVVADPSLFIRQKWVRPTAADSQSRPSSPRAEIWKLSVINRSCTLERSLLWLFFFVDIREKKNHRRDFFSSSLFQKKKKKKIKGAFFFLRFFKKKKKKKKK